MIARHFPIGVLALGIAATAGGLSGCSAHAGASARTPAALAGRVKAMEVTDRTFAPTLVELLATRDATPERLARLIGVVRYQLDRATRLFAAGHEEAGVEAVEGA